MEQLKGDLKELLTMVDAGEIAAFAFAAIDLEGDSELSAYTMVDDPEIEGLLVDGVESLLERLIQEEAQGQIEEGTKAVSMSWEDLRDLAHSMACPQEDEDFEGFWFDATALKTVDRSLELTEALACMELSSTMSRELFSAVKHAKSIVKGQAGQEVNS